jgi:uncharacterized protein (TIGR02594 family)
MHAWYETAKDLIGTREKPGTANNPVIVEWARSIGGWTASFYTKDEIPWCGLFVAHCLSEAGISIPKNPLSALEYNKWGTKLDRPSPGAIMVFGRNGGGHVGFYVSEDATTYHILGGNQSDMVNVARLDKKRLRGIRWPKGLDLPSTGPVIAKFEGPLSLNEA